MQVVSLIWTLNIVLHNYSNPAALLLTQKVNVQSNNENKRAIYNNIIISNNCKGKKVKSCAQVICLECHVLRCWFVLTFMVREVQS